jgi:hypothetical protein
MKWLHREIASSRTYQASWQTNDTNQQDARNFSHSVIRRLPAEVAADAIQHAVASADEMRQMHEDPTEERWIGAKSGLTRQQANNAQYYAVNLFGKPTRTTSCDCERSLEPSLLQTIYLRNDDDIYKAIDGGWLKELGRSASKARDKDDDSGDARQIAAQVRRLEDRVKKLKKADKDKEAKGLEKQLSALKKRAHQLDQERGDDERKEKDSQPSPALSPKQLVTEAYLRTVGRLPNEREMDKSTAYLAQSDDTLSGMRDLLWALLNTKEFIVNR